MLLSDSGVVKLIDFGVAKARGRLGAETSAGFAKGKARYMAPEQASGIGLDRRADVWAAGAVLYELLASRTPIEGDNDMVVLKKLVTDEPIEPLAVSVPDAVRAVVDRALCKEPDDRWATAAAMRDAIEEAMSSLGLRATSGDIERTLREQLADRIEERKQSVEAAMRAADRARGGELHPDRRRELDGFAEAVAAERHGRRGDDVEPNGVQAATLAHRRGRRARRRGARRLRADASYVRRADDAERRREHTSTAPSSAVAVATSLGAPAVTSATTTATGSVVDAAAHKPTRGGEARAVGTRLGWNRMNRLSRACASLAISLAAPSCVPTIRARRPPTHSTKAWIFALQERRTKRSRSSNARTRSIQRRSRGSSSRAR